MSEVDDGDVGAARVACAGGPGLSEAECAALGELVGWAQGLDGAADSYAGFTLVGWATSGLNLRSQRSDHRMSAGQDDRDARAGTGRGLCRA